MAAHFPIVQCVYTCVQPLVPLHISEWAFDQSFCNFPKDDFILGHPVYIFINFLDQKYSEQGMFFFKREWKMNSSNTKYWSQTNYKVSRYSENSDFSAGRHVFAEILLLCLYMAIVWLARLDNKILPTSVFGKFLHVVNCSFHHYTPLHCIKQNQKKLICTQNNQDVSQKILVAWQHER